MKVFFSELRLFICNNWINRIPSHRMRLFYYRKVMGFRIGTGSSIFMRVSFDCASNFSMGNNCVINAKCRLDNRGVIRIGDNVSISEDVILLTADHDPETPNMQGRNKKITIEDYAFIGTRAMVLPGVTLGFASVTAAGALVTKSCNDYEVIAGVPAKKIKERPNIKPSYKASYRRKFQ